jgi:DNA-binding HxlR family transcriptional regulator
MGWQKEIIPMLVKNGKMSTTAIRKELEKIHSIGCDNRQSSARLREALLRLERAGHVTYTYESGVATTAIWSLTEKLQSNLWESTQ